MAGPVRIAILADAGKAQAQLLGLQKSLGGIGKAGALARAGLLAAGAGIGAGLAYAVKSAANFEQGLSNIKSVSGATAAQMDLLSSKAKQIGAATTFGATDAAGAMEELAKAGVSVADILSGAADATVALAAAGGVDLPQAATIAANAMNQFNLAAGDLPKIADQIAGAANASAIDVSQFGMSMAQAGATAKLAGLSFPEMATAIAELGNAGIIGSDAGTSLKTMLSRLVPSTKTATDEMKKLGLITADGTNKFFDQSGKLKNLGTVQQLLADSLKGLTKEQKLAALQAVFGSDAIRAAAVLAGEGAKGYDKLSTAIGKVKASAVAKTKMDNLKGAIEGLKGASETLAINIGEKLLPDLSKLAKAAAEFVSNPPTELVSAFKDAKTVISALVPDLDKIAAVLKNPIFQASAAGALAAVAAYKVATLTMTAYSVVVGLSSVATRAATLSQLGLNAALLANPIGLTVVAVAALAAGMIVLYKRSATARNIMVTAFSAIGLSVLSMASIAVKGMHLLTDGVLNGLRILLKAMTYLPGQAGDQAKATLRQFHGFKDGVDKTFNKVENTLDHYKKKLTDLPKVVKLNADKDEAEKKIKQLQATADKLPKEKRIAVNAEIAQAQKNLDLIRAKLLALKNKNVTVTTFYSEIQRDKATAARGAVKASAFSTLGTPAEYAQYGTQAITAFATGSAKAAKQVLGKPFKGLGLVNNSYVRGLLGIPGDDSALANAARTATDDLQKKISDRKAKAVDAALDTYNKTVEKIRKKYDDADDAEQAKALIEKAKKARDRQITQARTEAAVLIERAKAQETIAVALAHQRDAVAAKLEAANEKLQAAVEARTDFVNTVRESIAQMADLSNLPLLDVITGKDADGNDITAQIQTATNIVDQLAKRAQAAASFTSTLTSLQNAGLSADYIKQLAQLGPDAAGATVDALRSATPAQIAAINASQSQILDTAKAFGTKLGDDYFQSGVNSAAKLVAGLQSQQAALEAQAVALANAFNRAFNTTIKFPTTGSASGTLDKVANNGKYASSAQPAPIHLTLNGSRSQVEYGREIVSAINSYMQLNGPVAIKVRA